MKKMNIEDGLIKKLSELTHVENIKPEDSLKELGINSIMIMKAAAFLKRRGFRVTFGELTEKNTLKEWLELIESKGNVIGQKEIRYEKTDDCSRVYSEEAFNLTDVQYAYWAGRQDDQELGGVGCHAYFEFDGHIKDVHRLKEAWRKLQEVQPVLRTRFTANGKQYIPRQYDVCEMIVHDYSNMEESLVKNKLDGIRNRLSHEKLKVEEGKNINLECAILPDGNTRLYLDVDLLVADVASIHILITCLADIYSEKEVKSFNRDVFRRHIESIEQDRQQYAKDEDYWHERIKNYPMEEPELPLIKRPENVEKVHFVRKSRKIKKEMWEILKKRAKGYGMTPAMLLLTAYGCVLSRWINDDSFIINIPVFSRADEEEESKGLIADFTNLLLLKVNNSATKTFLDYYNEIKNDFANDVSHMGYSGVKVLREISRQTGTAKNIAPIVFACNIDFPFENEETKKTLGELSYMISQTPQVWLDFQSFSDGDNLLICWDYVEQLFDASVIDDMFEALIQTVEKLALTQDWNVEIDVLPKEQMSVREKEASDIMPLTYPKDLLYTGFLENEKNNPDAVAIIDVDTEIKITYRQLKERALSVAASLVEAGVSCGDYVSVTLARGYRQVIALLGVLFASAAYVPVSDSQPQERRKKIYDQIGIKCVVSDEAAIQKSGLKEDGIAIVNLDDAKIFPDMDKPVAAESSSSAYVIMTSGSTGVPKGVEIRHASAMNTILDLNNKYSVSPKDALLMVSAIDFDLSVYDIFGMLTAGGTIVTLNEDNYKNPDIWLDAIKKYSVTQWNSVPILFNMLITMAEGKGVVPNLRLVFLSGDWIPLELPGRFYSLVGEKSLVVAMGGATEASIWSNYQEVPRKLPDKWISIPYGRPLYQQVYRVLDKYGRICPNMVEGELQIGGVGVARGYKSDEPLTAAKFYCDKDGMPWYRTGDNGRIWTDGTIEFLGRRDSQVKIKGHRIELGEIENAIRNFPGADRSVVCAVGEKERRRIVAFIASDKRTDVCLTDSFCVEADRRREMAKFKESLNLLTVDLLKGVFADAGFDITQDMDMEDVYRKMKVCDEHMKKVLQLWRNLLLDANGYKEDDIDYIGEGKYRNFVTAFEKLRRDIPKILSGSILPVQYFYQEKCECRPDVLVKKLEGYEDIRNSVVKKVKEVTSHKEKIAILDYAGRDPVLVKALLRECGEFISRYTICENTGYYKAYYESLLEEYPVLGYTTDVNEAGEEYDVVTAMCSIHREAEQKHTLNKLGRLLKPDGYLFAYEPDDELLVVSVIPALLDGNICDRVLKGKSVMDTEGTDGYSAAIYTPADRISVNELKEYLNGKILPYMMPHAFIFLDSIPQSKNGKVDYKKLAVLAGNQAENKAKDKDRKPEKEITKTITATMLKIKKVFEEVLKTDVQIDDNYFSVGGDSLMATRIIGKLQNEGIVISIKNIFENPSIESLAKYVDEHASDGDYKMKDNMLIVDDKNQFEPFPLTGVQFAYWVGRKGAFHMGSVSTQCYFEFDCDSLDASHLQKVWNDMIEYHGMLRSIVLPTGQQQIFKEPPVYIIQTENISMLDENRKMTYLKEKSRRLSGQVMNPERWPLFDIKLTVIDLHTTRLHICFDNLILDGFSMFLLLDEMSQRYKDSNYHPEKLKISFRDYVMTLEKARESVRYEKDKKYWLDRLDNFSAAPGFKLATQEKELKEYRFVRRSMKLSYSQWNRLCALAADNGFTATVFIMTVFADTLRKYSSNKSFSLNLTQFDRSFNHGQINNLVGDFTNLTLLEVKYLEGSSFVERAKALQKQLIQDMEHSLYCAVEFERQLRKRDNNRKDSVMPVVFTSGIGMTKWSDSRWLGKLVYNISQTPQVWIDHQIVEWEDGLELNWDCVDELLAEGLTDEMFEYYKRILVNYIMKDGEIDKKGTSDESAYESIISNADNDFHKEKVTAKVIVNEEAVPEDMSEKSSQTLNSLIRIWEDILGISVRKDKTFFEQGGDSLGMVKMVNLINDTFGIDISIADVAENDRLDALAKFLDNTSFEGTI